jgi:PAS domain S-box-containing protein
MYLGLGSWPEDSAMNVATPDPPRSSALQDELLARAFGAAPNGFVLVDRDGLIVAANRELAAMFGYEEAGLVGMPVDDLLPNALREAHRATRASFFAQPERRSMGAGRVLYGRRADGHEFPVEIGLNPVDGPAGTLVLASVVDVSERLALEWAFRGLFDASPFGLLIVDDDGRVALVNRVLCETLGYPHSALVDQPLDLLLPERYRRNHGSLMSGYRVTGEARAMGQGRDLTALHRDGTEVPVEIGLSRVRWQRRTMTLAAITDISTRKRLELDLRQANANLEQFTHVASHDLRSPLRGIADLIEWIGADLGSSASGDVTRNLGRVSQRIQRMERLIDDLLRYARANRAATDFEPLDVEAIVRNILEIQPVAPDMVIDIQLDVTTFQGVRTPLETALRNLIANAVKHHDQEAGHIVVRSAEDDSYCLLTVTDDGPGIPEAAQERIFKLFQTLTASERGSAGIGLALTKRIVEVHGGRIGVESPVADGRGSCFKIWWPRFPRRVSDGT